MWKNLFELVWKALKISEKAQENSDKIKVLQQQVEALGKMMQHQNYEIQRIKDHEQHEREMLEARLRHERELLELQRENERLRAERSLPPAKTEETKNNRIPDEELQ